MSHELLPVYVLAGGRSSRFGADKARVILEGEPLLVRIVHRARAVASTISIVADTPAKYADLGLRTIADRTPNLGPLGGLEAALLDLPPNEDWLLLLSCDLVDLRSTWLRSLRSARRAGVGAVMFRDDRMQPLVAMYHRSILGNVQTLIEQGGGSMRALIGQLDVITLSVPPDWPETPQINTREDLSRAARVETRDNQDRNG